jgi:hypothetical protein
MPDPTTVNAPLSIVEEDALEDWLAVADISDYIESRLRPTMVELEQRLGEVLGRRISGQSRRPAGDRPHRSARSLVRAATKTTAHSCAK